MGRVRNERLMVCKSAAAVSRRPIAGLNRNLLPFANHDSQPAIS